IRYLNVTGVQTCALPISGGDIRRDGDDPGGAADRPTFDDAFHQRGDRAAGGIAVAPQLVGVIDDLRAGVVGDAHRRIERVAVVEIGRASRRASASALMTE